MLLLYAFILIYIKLHLCRCYCRMQECENLNLYNKNKHTLWISVDESCLMFQQHHNLGTFLCVT